MSESIPAEAIEAKKSKFVDAAKQAILARLRPVIEYKIREAIAPGTITDEQELNQFFVNKIKNIKNLEKLPKFLRHSLELPGCSQNVLDISWNFLQSPKCPI